MGRIMNLKFAALRRDEAAWKAAYPDKQLPDKIDALANWASENPELIPEYSPPPEDLLPSSPYDDPSHPFYQPPKGIDESKEAYMARLKKIMLEDRARKPEGRNHVKDNLPTPGSRQTDEEEILAWMQALAKEQWSYNPPLHLGWKPKSVPASQMASFYPEGTDVVALDANPDAENNPLPNDWVWGAGALPKLPSRLPFCNSFFIYMV
jgi:hypothetical protein